MRSLTPVASIVLVAIITTSLTGCVFSREISNTRRDIERAYPEMKLEKQIVLNLGPISLRTLRWIAGMVPDDEVDMAVDYMRDVSRVKVGVFRSENADAFGAFDPEAIHFDDGWETAVKTRDEESRVWVLYRDGDEQVRDIYVVVLDGEDLAIARVRGNLNRLLARIMEDHVDLNRLVGEGS